MLTPFRVSVAFVLANVALLFGSQVPHQNEYVYLLRLKALDDPSYLRGDWTFQGPFYEHVVFNTLFSPITKVVSIEVLGWVGRVTCWVVLTVLVLELARRIGVAPWPAAFALVAWIACQPRVVGGDWVFGTFEAKPIAYIFLFGAIIAALRGSAWMALVAAGLAFSFHPGVGIWAAPPLVVAMAFDPKLGRATRRWSWLALVAALPGIWGILYGLGDTDAQSGVWSFVVDRVFPFHLDPLYFGAAVFVALWLMFGFNVVYCFAGESSGGLRLLGRFQVLLAVPMVAGLLAVWLDADEYLKYLPFRVFPVLTTLLFAFFVAREWPWRHFLTKTRPRLQNRVLAGAAVLAVALAFVGANPVKEYAFAVRANFREWRHSDTDFQRTLRWISESTPPTAVFILPPSSLDTFYLGQRPQVANLKAISYEDIAEWRDRIVALLGDTDADAVLIPDDEKLEAGYDRLTPQEIEDLQRRYGAQYLVSRGRYDYEVIHRDGAYTVYKLPVAAGS